MSFILDALKKSEQARPAHSVPDLRTDHGKPAPVPQRRRLWPAVLAVALLLNAVFLLWWLRPWSPTEPSPSTSPPAPAPTVEANVPRVPVPPLSVSSQETERGAANRTGPSVAVQKSVPVVGSAKEDVPITSPAVHKGVRGKEEASSPRAARRDEVTDIGGLPPEVRQSLPPFEITLHFYTENPASRMVRINGRNLREGQKVTEGLSLEKITASGVVLDWRGHRFRTGDF